MLHNSQRDNFREEISRTAKRKDFLVLCFYENKHDVNYPKNCRRNFWEEEGRRKNFAFGQREKAMLVGCPDELHNSQRDNYSLTAIIKKPRYHNGFRGFLFLSLLCLLQFYLVVGTHSKRYLQTVPFVIYYNSIMSNR